MLPLFWDDSHHDLCETTRSWVDQYIRPFAAEWEERNEFPRELYYQAGEVGLLGVDYPEEYGGEGGDIFHTLLVTEEMIRGGSTGTAIGLGSHAISLPPILALGTEEQKQRFAPPVIKGDKIACLAITEPGAGSDVSGIRTTARKDGASYIINGSKTYITSGCRADTIVLLARTGPEKHAGLSLFVVEKGTAGLSVGKPLKKMGWWASDTGELFFSDCRIPEENRIGPEGAGFPGIMVNFVKERLFLSANCVAIAQLAFDETQKYVHQREAFGRPISKFQVVRHDMAEMITQLEQSRAFVSLVAEEFRQGKNVNTKVAMAKNASVAMCSYVTDRAVQLHGGMGYMREAIVERLFRDARLYPIGGGTTEIMRELISKTL